MKKKLGIFLVFFGFVFSAIAQNQTSVQGQIIDSDSQNPLGGVFIKLKDTSISVKTSENGTFKIENLSVGDYIIAINFDGYQELNIPVSILENETYDLGTIFLFKTTLDFIDPSIISLNEEDLSDDDSGNSVYVSGMFQSSKDVYLKAAAYNFSQAWFKVRGYDSANGTILINGVRMNKFFGGRPQWSNWGGLNDAFRNQEFSNGISASPYSFGDILGTTNFSVRATDFRATKKVSLSSTNRSYRGRLMATYATGLNSKNWAFVASASRRMAQNGYFEGTTYNAWSGFLAVEKKLNDNHSFNFSAIVASNRRGKSSPNTQEVYDLKGYKYNSYWGNQVGEKRNSRIKEIFEPVAMLTHYFNSEKMTIQSTIAYQFGHIGNSRLGYYKTPNPDPTYWQYLPSSFLNDEENPNYGNAYKTEQAFINNGQIDWKKIYDVNNNRNSLYYLYEDRTDDSQLSFNSILSTSFLENYKLNAGVSFQSLKSENYANMLDLLGGSGFVDLDQYGDKDAEVDETQNDLNNPNRTVFEGDKFQYNYNLNASTIGAFAQIQYSGNKIDYFGAIDFKSTNYQREGLYKNGTYSDNSFGKGEKQSFADISAKGGITYKHTGRHLINLNAGYFSKAPTIRNTFSNSRVNNNITPNVTSEKILTADLSYIYRSPKLQARLTGFYTTFSDVTETSFFFAEGLLGDQADFVNEIVTGIDKKNIGVELSASYRATSTIKILAAGSFGQFTYDNNPNLYLESESFLDENSDFGTTNLKNYRISGTPQRAYSLGFEYQDPKYWWFQANANYMSNNYLDISPLLRTENFYLDAGGVPFVDDETGVQVTQEQVDSLLTQEKFDDILLVNLVGGKSWKIEEKYVGFFIGVNNILNELFKSGGFEQSRNANYQQLKQDKTLTKPVFGPKYWYGNEASYYLNLYIRF